MIDLAAIRRAFRRSRLRSDIPLVVDRMGECSVRDLALALGAEPANVLGALIGAEGAYRVEESLQRLGIVSVAVRGGEWVVSLTLVGREIAAQLRQRRLVHST